MFRRDWNIRYSSAGAEGASITASLEYKFYAVKGFYISKSVYTPKQVSKTGLLTGMKIASINQTKKINFEASLVPAYAGKQVN